MILIVFLILLSALALTAIKWGADSRDCINSEEWRRRSNASYHQHHD